MFRELDRHGDLRRVVEFDQHFATVELAVRLLRSRQAIELKTLQFRKKRQVLLLGRKLSEEDAQMFHITSHGHQRLKEVLVLSDS